MLKFNGDLSKAPYGKNLLVALKDGTIHTGTKTVVTRYSGLNPEGCGSDQWKPVSVVSAYSEETGFDDTVIGWIDFDNVNFVME